MSVLSSILAALTSSRNERISETVSYSSNAANFSLIVAMSSIIIDIPSFSNVSAIEFSSGAPSIFASI